MSISIVDPKYSEFPIFDSEMFPDKAGKSFEIPFGTANTGTHEIKFTVMFPAQAETSECANIYISLEKAYEWPINVKDNKNVDTFQDKTTIVYKHYLEGGTMYKGRISRISAVSSIYSSIVSSRYFS